MPVDRVRSQLLSVALREGRPVTSFPGRPLFLGAPTSRRQETGDIVAAMRLVRHESVATTQTYLHPTQEDLVARMREVRW